MGKVVLMRALEKDISDKHIKNDKADKPINKVALYNYQTNLEMCERLFLVKPGEFPSTDKLEQLASCKARKMIYKLNKIFRENAEKRHIKLTGKTMAQAAVDRMDEWFSTLMN